MDGTHARAEHAKTSTAENRSYSPTCGRQREIRGTWKGSTAERNTEQHGTVSSMLCFRFLEQRKLRLVGGESVRVREMKFPCRNGWGDFFWWIERGAKPEGEGAGVVVGVLSLCDISVPLAGDVRGQQPFCSPARSLSLPRIPHYSDRWITRSLGECKTQEMN